MAEFPPRTLVGDPALLGWRAPGSGAYRVWPGSVADSHPGCGGDLRRRLLRGGADRTSVPLSGGSAFALGPLLVDEIRGLVRAGLHGRAVGAVRRRRLRPDYRAG